MSKIKCVKCGKMAIWLYMPSGGNGYCDECVPRGCTCVGNQTDEYGRKLPCCEFGYDEEGFDI